MSFAASVAALRTLFGVPDEAAVADGPHEGRYLALYVDRPFGQESLAPNDGELACRPPPTGGGP